MFALELSSAIDRSGRVGRPMLEQVTAVDWAVIVLHDARRRSPGSPRVSSTGWLSSTSTYAHEAPESCTPLRAGHPTSSYAFCAPDQGDPMRSPASTATERCSAPSATRRPARPQRERGPGAAAPTGAGMTPGVVAAAIAAAPSSHSPASPSAC